MQYVKPCYIDRIVPWSFDTGDQGGSFLGTIDNSFENLGDSYLKNNNKYFRIFFFSRGGGGGGGI